MRLYRNKQLIYIHLWQKEVSRLASQPHLLVFPHSTPPHSNHILTCMVSQTRTGYDPPPQRGRQHARHARDADQRRRSLFHPGTTSERH